MTVTNLYVTLEASGIDSVVFVMLRLFSVVSKQIYISLNNAPIPKRAKHFMGTDKATSSL